MKYSVSDSIYWVYAFIFGTMFLGVAALSYSWQFAHAITVCLLFLAFLEYFGKKRIYLIGLFCGLILLTRLTAALVIIFFVFDIALLEKYNLKTKIINIFRLAVVPGICLCLLFSYNYARFNNIFEQGYRGQILSPSLMEMKNYYGLFNVRYLSRGLKNSLINTPNLVYNPKTHILSFPYLKPNLWGMSIFITSPYLLYLFFMKINDKKAKALLAVSMMTGLVIMTSFFTGYIQFGFRYALDFMPPLFIALMILYKSEEGKLNLIMKTTILLSGIFNLYLLFQMPGHW